MRESESKLAEATESRDAYEQERAGGRAAPTAPSPPTERPAAPGLFRVIKPGQGIHVRWGSAIGAAALALAGAQFVYEQIQVFRFVQDNFYLRAGVPVVLLAVAFYFIFWAVGRRQSIVDFMIATEGEMKKVNWSTRREVWGATRVVIVTVLALGLILAVVDLALILFLSAIKVLRMNLIEKLISAGTT